MDFVAVAHTPLAPSAEPARIAYRSFGRIGGTALVVLHGGWGYDAYPFDRQIAAFSASHRIVVPDRSGYGESPAIDALPADFHQRAVEETVSVLDALSLRAPVLWGHSDGAIIALLLALARPDRVSAVVAEATHFFKRKPSSITFFENVVANPSSTPIMRAHAQAWLQIGAAAASAGEDFYGGRLGAIGVRTLLVHGGRDPRTEPGEIDAVRRAAPTIDVRVFADASHSPHSDSGSADAVTALVGRFLDA